jgi:O-antigen ligase
MLSASAFILIVLVGYVLALVRGPFWGLLTYVYIYFNPPNPAINWWASYLPFDRWSLLSTIVLIVSMLLHWNKASDRSLGSARWMIVFFVLSLIITLTLAVNPDDANQLQYLLFTYCLIVFIMIKTITQEKQLRALLTLMVVLAGNLGVYAWLYGKRINDRLEGTGSIDAFGANEFGLLLASLVPFVALLLINGRKFERILCLLAAPFILNAFILCNSRGAAVALMIATGVSALLFGDRRIRRGLTVMALCAIPVLFWLMDDAFIERLSTLAGGNDTTNVYGEPDEDLNELSSGRIAIWNYGMQMAADHPFGAGPDGFRDLAHLYMPPEILVEKGQPEYGRRAAHNTYLQVIVEQGVAGLAIFLFMCVSVILTLRRSFKSVQKKLDPFWLNLLFATAVSFLTTLAGGLVTNRVYYEFFWWQIALVVVTASLAHNEIAQVERKAEAPEMTAAAVVA